MFWRLEKPFPVKFANEMAKDAIHTAKLTQDQIPRK